jgi:hypothetical protein
MRPLADTLRALPHDKHAVRMCMLQECKQLPRAGRMLVKWQKTLGAAAAWRCEPEQGHDATCTSTAPAGCLCRPACLNARFVGVQFCLFLASAALQQLLLDAAHTAGVGALGAVDDFLAGPTLVKVCVRPLGVLLLVDGARVHSLGKHFVLDAELEEHAAKAKVDQAIEPRSACQADEECHSKPQEALPMLLGQEQEQAAKARKHCAHNHGKLLGRAGQKLGLRAEEALA